MPILRSIGCACWAGLWGCVFFFALELTAQSAPTSVSGGDSISLLAAAADANGAPGADAKPWRAKISFTLDDRNGKPQIQGTFEEFWAAPDKVKRIYATPSFNQVEYTTPSGVLRTGSRDSAPYEITRIVDQFLHPIALDRTSIEAAKLQATDITLGTAKLSCIAVVRSAGSNAVMPANPAMRGLWTKLLGPVADTYCLDKSAPILRLIVADGGSSRIIRNGHANFADHVLPKSVEEFSSGSPSSEGKPVYAAKLEAIEPITTIQDAMFAPPQDAMPAPKVVTLPERETRSQQVHHSYPQYDYEVPGNTYNVHTAGFVVVVLQVHTDGSVSPLRALSGPPGLRQVSLDALKKWTYKPFRVNGEPVEVITTASLVYSLRP